MLKGNGTPIDAQDTITHRIQGSDLEKTGDNVYEMVDDKDRAQSSQDGLRRMVQSIRLFQTLNPGSQP
jgi:hypothetical protein